MQNKFEKIIYGWVKQNFGKQEADDPSWSIKALAKELNKNFRELYWQQELEYLKEDVERYAVDNKVELTEQQIYYVADKIRNSEWYCSISREDMDYYINEELKRGE